MSNEPIKPQSLSRRGILLGGGALALGTASALVVPGVANAQTLTQNATGTHNGYYYSFWTDSQGRASMTLGSGGNYSSQWNGANNWVGGKGWANGGRRNVNYTAGQPGSNSYLALYGWTSNPLVEYYIVETTALQPQQRRHQQGHGQHQREHLRHSVTPCATTPRRWRAQDLRAVLERPAAELRSSGGTIDTGAHFDAWARAGMNLGAFSYYMIMATEGYQSTGSSNITVS